MSLRVVELDRCATRGGGVVIGPGPGDQDAGLVDTIEPRQRILQRTRQVVVGTSERAGQWTAQDTLGTRGQGLAVGGVQWQQRNEDEWREPSGRRTHGSEADAFRPGSPQHVSAAL